MYSNVYATEEWQDVELHLWFCAQQKYLPIQPSSAVNKKKGYVGWPTHANDV